LHGSKRETAALAAMPDGIALAPRQGCASPGCKGPHPALDPAPGLALATSLKHFSGKRNLAARFARILAAINKNSTSATAIVAQALFVGWENAVREMKRLMLEART